MWLYTLIAHIGIYMTEDFFFQSLIIALVKAYTALFCTVIVLHILISTAAQVYQAINDKNSKFTNL